MVRSFIVDRGLKVPYWFALGVVVPLCASACATANTSSDPLSAWSGADEVDLSSGREEVVSDDDFRDDDVGDDSVDPAASPRNQRRFLALPTLTSVFETERQQVLACGAENTVAQTVDRYMRAQRPRVHACYTTLLRSDRDLSGTIRVQVQVNPDGRVRANISDNGTGSSTLAGCVENVLERGQLSCVPGESETFLFPLVFDS